MKKISTFQPCSSVVRCIDFLSSNADMIVCGDENGNISMFSTKSSRIVWKNKDLFGCQIYSVAISPNKDVVAGGGSNGRLRVINAANGNSICSIDFGSWIVRVLFLSQQKIACGLWNGTVAIVNWQTQKIEKMLKIGDRPVNALAISPVNCDILWTGDYGGVIKQTIISSEKTVMMYEGHTDYVNDLKFLSCGNMFVSGSADRTARLFALDQKQAIRVFTGHIFGVGSVSLIHDDEILITISYDETVKVWKIESGECLSTVKTEQNVQCGSVSKDEQSLVVDGDNGTVTLFSCPPRFAVSLDRTLKLC